MQKMGHSARAYIKKEIVDDAALFQRKFNKLDMTTFEADPYKRFVFLDGCNVGYA